MTALPLVIRHEHAGDAEAIERLHARAFGPGRFARTAYRLREGTRQWPNSASPRWSRPISSAPCGSGPAEAGEPLLVLGPLTVDPSFEGRGIGAALMTASLDAATAAGHGLVILDRRCALLPALRLRADPARPPRSARPRRPGPLPLARTGPGAAAHGLGERDRPAPALTPPRAPTGAGRDGTRWTIRRSGTRRSRRTASRSTWPASGAGAPLVLLHGWPEFWLTWEPVMRRLADRFELIAPDLRGFGASEKPDRRPSDKAGADVHAADIVALLDALGIARAGIVGHDVGAYVIQALGRAAPERLTGLFTFDCPYPGIGPRLAAPEMLAEIWYQSYHVKPFAAAQVGASREGCRLYIGHFLRHWAGGNPAAFDDVLDAFVDNFLAPGNLQGGFNWYVSAQAGRLAMIRGEAPTLPPITVPTCVRWGDPRSAVPLCLDRPPRRDVLGSRPRALEGRRALSAPGGPDRAAAEIARFFERLPG